MVLEREKGGPRRREWKWGDETTKEVKGMKYLGYIMQKNGEAEKHGKERIRRAMIVMKQTWNIGERLFKDFERGMKMFKSLVRSVILYGAEIWGWSNEERVDRIIRIYTKWLLGLDRRTPNYILVEETKMKELSRERQIRRTVKYKENTRKAKKKIVVECMKELDRRSIESEERKWEKKRRKIMEETEISKIKIEKNERRKMQKKQ